MKKAFIYSSKNEEKTFSISKIKRATCKKLVFKEDIERINEARKLKAEKYLQKKLSKLKVTEAKIAAKRSAKINANDASSFEFVHNNENIHDTKFETKPVSFLQDSIRRFAKNKASVVAFGIILLIVIFSIVGPLTVKSSAQFNKDFPSGYDATFKDVLPKAFDTGTGFWDGTSYQDVPESQYYFEKYTDSNYPRIVVDDENPKEVVNEITKQSSLMYHVSIDSYAVGIKVIPNMPKAEYEALVKYDLEKYGEHHIIKPSVDYDSYVTEYEAQLEAEDVASIPNIITNINARYQGSDSIYYKLVAGKKNGKYTNQVVPEFDENGNPIDLYMRDADGNLIYGYSAQGGNTYKVRVDYLDYFEYKYGYIPKFYFGTNNLGQDLYLRLANGASFSLLLGVGVTVINFVLGLIWGAIAGYYGGRIDLLMERFTDILSAIPSIVVMSIVSLNMKNNPSLGAAAPIVALLIGFIATGWIGTAATTRMQFYRFKGQEYVLASRTLGAKDRRLIFRHILPNAAGTLVTSSVLMIPSVIFSESTLTYLGVINLSLTNTTSIGTLLSEGQKYMTTQPYLLVFPAIVISLLMVSFNLFGNGLRDAFNTTLRGED